jgi:hypothetical protein
MNFAKKKISPSHHFTSPTKETIKVVPGKNVKTE